jgi:type I restriction enzyme S subunit
MNPLAQYNDDLPEAWAPSMIGSAFEVNPRKVAAEVLPPHSPVTFVPMPAVDAEAGAITNGEDREFASVRKSYTSFKEDDVIVAKITPCMENGKAAIARGLTNGLGFGSTEFHVLRPTGAALPEYVYHFVRQESYRREAMQHMTGTVGQKRVPAEFIEESLLPIAPLAEQKRIVARVEGLLGRVRAARERLAKVPAILKRFRQSVLAAACSGRLTEDWRGSDENGWERCSLGELINDGPQNGLYKPQGAYGAGVLIVRIDNFYDGQIQPWHHLKRLQVSERELASYALCEGDILVNRVNSMPFLGKSGLVRHLVEPCVFESNMMRLAVDARRISAEYLIRYLSSGQGLSELRKNAKHAVNQSSINQGDVTAVLVPIPPLPEQEEIVRRVEALFKLADAIEKRVAAATARAEKLTQSILAKAFRGELVPPEAELARRQGRDYEPASVLLERIRAERARSDTNPKPKRTRGGRGRVRKAGRR